MNKQHHKNQGTDKMKVVEKFKSGLSYKTPTKALGISQIICGCLLKLTPWRIRVVIFKGMCQKIVLHRYFPANLIEVGLFWKEQRTKTSDCRCPNLVVTYHKRCATVAKGGYKNEGWVQQHATLFRFLFVQIWKAIITFYFTIMCYFTVLVYCEHLSKMQ